MRPRRTPANPSTQVGVQPGVVTLDPQGKQKVIPFTLPPGGTSGGTPPSSIGSGNTTTTTNITDNSIVRGDGGTTGVQGSTPKVADDGRITDVTDPTGAQDAATKAYVDANAGSGGGHLHGLFRMLGDGATTTFDLLDIAEYLELWAVNGVVVDPTTFALSADGTQIVFDVAPPATEVVTGEYVILNA